MMPTANENGFGSVTFAFKNVGPVKNAKMELGDLTMVAGHNNTGKTCLVYTLYGFLATWDKWPGVVEGREPAAPGAPARRSIVERIVEQITERGRAIVEADPDATEPEYRRVI